MVNKKKSSRASKPSKAQKGSSKVVRDLKLYPSDRKRYEFKCDFRARSVFSFGGFLMSLDEVRDCLSEDCLDRNMAGLYLGDSYKYLAHSIEMLSKACLMQKSSLLVLDKLSFLDKNNDDLKDASKEVYCVGAKSLIRASKFFKKSLTYEDVYSLLRVIEERGKFEHRFFVVKSLKGSMHLLVSNMQLVVDIYNRQFREGDLIGELDVENLFDSFVTEFSKDFRKVETAKNKKVKLGSRFVRCLDCSYDFAELLDVNSYECLWCGSKRFRKVCSEGGCDQVSNWLTDVSYGNVSADYVCGSHRPVMVFDKSMVDSFRESLRSSGFSVSPKDLDFLTDTQFLKSDRSSDED